MLFVYLITLKKVTYTFIEENSVDFSYWTDTGKNNQVYIAQKYQYILDDLYMYSAIVHILQSISTIINGCSIWQLALQVYTKHEHDCYSALISVNNASKRQYWNAV